ncbi:hypothetical protein [Streptomyces sp. NPDC005780]|uniref:hypothetical protein n=1 Tax=Streptomyces sp. NPDC005780 TaxID=3364730 RepID=UPI00369FCE12
MPWFKVDDKAHSHPKFMRAGNAALGLWLRCGSYAAQHLTEGIVPGVVAQLYGTVPQAKKLVKAGLWHDHGHGCDRCADPLDGDYVIHDFLEDGRNTSRAKYDAERKKARDRQAKHRESRGFADESSSKTDRFADDSSSKKSESASEKTEFPGSSAGQGYTSRRDENVTGIHAGAAPVPNPSTSYGSTGAAADGERSGLPDQLAELKRGIAAAGLTGVAWDLRESGWEYTRQAMTRVGVPAMVAYAASSARLKGLPAGASAWVQGWRSLEPAPDEPGVSYLPAAVGSGPIASRQQQETNDLFDRAMQRAKTRMQEDQ